MLWDLAEIFFGVFLPSYRGPAQLEFNDVIRKSGGIENQTCIDSDGVGPEVIDVYAKDVFWIRINSFDADTDGECDQLIIKESNCSCLFWGFEVAENRRFGCVGDERPAGDNSTGGGDDGAAEG